MNGHRIDEFAGMRRELEVGIRLAPTAAAAPLVARRLAVFLEDRPDVSVRLCSIERGETRVHLTLAVCMGSIDEIKLADDRSRSAVTFLQSLVTEFASHDPAFVTLPAPATAAQVAADRSVRELVTVG